MSYVWVNARNASVFVLNVVHNEGAPIGANTVFVVSRVEDPILARFFSDFGRSTRTYSPGLVLFGVCLLLFYLLLFLDRRAEGGRYRVRAGPPAARPGQARSAAAGGEGLQASRVKIHHGRRRRPRQRLGHPDAFLDRQSPERRRGGVPRTHRRRRRWGRWKQGGFQQGSLCNYELGPIQWTLGHVHTWCPSIIAGH